MVVNYLKDSLGQIKIQQMIFMLIAVTFFIIFTGLFIGIIVMSDIKKSSEIINEKEAILLVSKLSDSPEFSCGNAFGTTRMNCIDFDKLIILKDMADKYKGFWGVAGIKVKKIFPQGGEGIECDNVNYPNCTEITLFSTSGTGLSNFVSICGKIREGEEIVDICEMGKIVVYYGG
ncbi:MAG: hypothetical protein QXU40_00680 [Candidatus Pacearchaeota archaeon]